jgi:aminopeptidase YwaD
MKMIAKIGAALIVLIAISFTEDKKKSPEVTAGEMKKHISFLSSDALKGRLTGNEGDSLAAEYIRTELKKAGLMPLYDNGFQRFRITDKIIDGPANRLVIKDNSLKVGSDFTPFAFSQNDSFNGEVVFAGYGFDIN